MPYLDFVTCFPAFVCEYVCYRLFGCRCMSIGTLYRACDAFLKLPHIDLMPLLRFLRLKAAVAPARSPKMPVFLASFILLLCLTTTLCFIRLPTRSFLLLCKDLSVFSCLLTFGFHLLCTSSRVFFCYLNTCRFGFLSFVTAQVFYLLSTARSYGLLSFAASRVCAL